MPEAEIDTFVAGFEVPEPSIGEAAEAEGVKPRDIEVGGRRLRYLELGEGDSVPVLLVHGFGADLNTWLFTQPALAASTARCCAGFAGAWRVGQRSRCRRSGKVDRCRRAGAGRARRSSGFISSDTRWAGQSSHSLASRRPERVASLTLIASAGLGPEINVSFIDGFVRVSRRREAAEVIGLLVHDPALVSRSMVEDVLRYKRLDGVPSALTKIAEAWFAGRPAVARFDRSDRGAGDAGSAGLGPR